MCDCPEAAWEGVGETGLALDMADKGVPRRGGPCEPRFQQLRMHMHQRSAERSGGQGARFRLPRPIGVVKSG